MFFEISLIQRLTLFLGFPTYSLSVTLASLLIFTGVGSLLSGRLRSRIDRLVPWLVPLVAVLTLAYLFLLPLLTDALLPSPLGVRIATAFVVLAPLGLCLGLFMPFGLGTIGDLDGGQEYVAWSWAVNGFAAVIASVLTTIIAMTFGFNVVLVLAAAAYMIAIAALWGLRRRVPRLVLP
jgi:hypothetical protein